MFQSNSIGVSSHKNEYKSGVRVGNWVEEMFGAEAEAAGDSLKARRDATLPGGATCHRVQSGGPQLMSASHLRRHRTS